MHLVKDEFVHLEKHQVQHRVFVFLVCFFSPQRKGLCPRLVSNEPTAGRKSTDTSNSDKTCIVVKWSFVLSAKMVSQRLLYNTVSLLK